MSNKPLTGREASVLALIAQSLSLSREDKDRILATLDGDALRIAKVMVGDITNPSKADKKAADGFHAWAAELPKVTT
jgi:hypothetical protein